MSRARRAPATLLMVLASALALASCGRDADVAVLALDVDDCPPGSNIILGTAGNDVIVGTSGPDCILGYDGDDVIDGASGDDFIVGGGGMDDLAGGNGADQIFGDDGDDTIAGGNGSDSIEGGPGNDIISGDNGPDIVNGGDGNDVILDSRGPAVIDPGGGVDSCSAPDCELPTATRCLATGDCAAGARCEGGACVYCHADSECDDLLVCTGAESCIPSVACQDGVDLPAGHDLGLTCVNGIGACSRAGSFVCDGSGGFGCDAVPGSPGLDDDCDLVDDDCDASSDEHYLARAVTCGVGACLASGITACGTAGETEVCVPGAPAIEACNGLDEDCDGTADNGLLDSDGDTLCDGPRIAMPSTGSGMAPDACPFHPDITMTPGFDIVTGQISVNTLGATGPLPIPSLSIHTGLGDTITDCRGIYTYRVPTGDPAFEFGDFEVQFWFQAAVAGPGGITSSVQVVDDFGAPWGRGLAHGGLDGGGYRRTVSSRVVTTDAAGRRTRRVAPVILGTSEAELYRIAVLVADDYHQVRGAPWPGGTLSFMREAGLLFELTPYAEYNFVRMPATILDLDSMSTPFQRESTLFHESGHVIRHIRDGGRSHWDGDLVRYVYGRCHTGLDITNEAFAFNEGWANYWSRGRYSSVPEQVFNLGRPLMSGGGRGAAVRTVEDVAAAAAAGVTLTPTTTDHCDGSIGSSGVALTEAHLDFVEDMVADRLLDISSNCFSGMSPEAADLAMLAVLESNAETIHSLFEFERALGTCTGTPVSGPLRTLAPPECPPDYNDDGEHCSREGHIIRERSG